MFKKILVFIFSLFCFQLCIYARTAVYEGETYCLCAIYDDDLYSGDPVFLQLDFSTTETKQQSLKAEAVMYIICKDSKKTIGKTELYTVDTSQHMTSLFAGYPLSTYVSEGNYILQIEYSFQNERTMKFNIPINIQEKQFIKETIPLDDSNTAIKTDISEERMNQIKILNALLEKNDTSSVFCKSTFMLPTNCTRRTSYFGDRRTYEYTDGKKSKSMHNGIDFGIPANSPVVSCAQGKCVMSEFRITTGWTAVIEHLPGLYSLYYHLNSLSIEVGQELEKGQKIGLSGSTGLSTGPHLHWEMRLLNGAVNPDYFVEKFSMFLKNNTN